MVKSILNHLRRVFGNDLNDEKLHEALDPNRNQKIAEIGDSLMDLIIRENEYKKPESNAKSLDDARQQYASKKRNKDILNIDEELTRYLINKHKCTSPPGKIGLQRSDTYMEAIIGAIYLHKGLKYTRKYVMEIYSLE